MVCTDRIVGGRKNGMHRQASWEGEGGEGLCVYLVDVGDAQAGEGVQQHLDIVRLEIDRHTDRQGERGSEAGVGGGI
jgi:hypothetical protein